MINLITVSPINSLIDDIYPHRTGPGANLGFPIGALTLLGGAPTSDMAAFRRKCVGGVQGGVAGTSQRDPILRFHKHFCRKAPASGGRRPPMGNPGSTTEMYAKTKE